MGFCNGEEPRILTEEEYKILYRILCYNQPINARRRDILLQPNLCDTINSCMDEDIEVYFGYINIYDDAPVYDESYQYDSSTFVLQTIIQTRCAGVNEFNDDFNDDYTI